MAFEDSCLYNHCLKVLLKGIFVLTHVVIGISQMIREGTKIVPGLQMDNGIFSAQV
jgi:hypothetical protein